MINVFLFVSVVVLIATAHTPQEWSNIFNNVKE